ncbi:hypothetical protein A9G29_10365 [Gilliamella sp. Fer2-1]|jgi:hypothetical protein|nr:hypothetical protein A9G29_10365 [Gilliamella apicola]
MNIDEFKYLWDGSEQGWCLLNLAEKGDAPIYFIENAITHVALIIENDEIAQLVIEKMLKENVTIKKP